MSSGNAIPRPLPGRECGECRVCCIHLAIDDPALTKADGERCRNLTDAGRCAIYEIRPATCARFYCGWRLINVDERLRPDRCGILILPEPCHDPRYRRGGLRLATVKDDADLLLQDGIIDLAATFIAQGVPIFLSHGEGDACKRILINGEVETALRNRDRPAFAGIVRAIVRQMADLVRQHRAGAGTGS